MLTILKGSPYFETTNAVGFANKGQLAKIRWQLRWLVVHLFSFVSIRFSPLIHYLTYEY